MNPKLLDDLLCPSCGGFPLRIERGVEGVGGKLEAGEVACPAGHSFRVTSYVLDLLGADGRSRVGEAYDEMWRAHPSLSYAGSEEAYARAFARDSALEDDVGRLFAGARVCDAGCGEGRYSFLASSLGAEHVVAVDSSREALGRAVAATANPGNCSFVRADLQRLPFRGSFDHVFAFGTLHHTADTRAALHAVACLVREQGLLSVYIYPRGMLPRVYPLLRPLTRRLSLSRMRRFADDWGFGYGPARRADLRAAARRLGRLDVLGLHGVTFEGLTTPYIRGHSRGEVEGWFRDAGFEVVAASDLVAVTGRRVRDAAPATPASPAS